MKDNIIEIKMVENGLVIILLFSMVIIFLPAVINFIGKSLILSARSNTEGTTQLVEELYININLTDDVFLPFEVVFNKEGYEIYTGKKKYTPIKKLKIKTKAKLPRSGSILIDSNGSRIIKNLKFGLVKCNQKANEKLVCKI